MAHEEPPPPPLSSLSYNQLWINLAEEFTQPLKVQVLSLTDPLRREGLQLVENRLLEREEPA